MKSSSKKTERTVNQILHVLRKELKKPVVPPLVTSTTGHKMTCFGLCSGEQVRDVYMRTDDGRWYVADYSKGLIQLSLEEWVLTHLLRDHTRLFHILVDLKIITFRDLTKLVRHYDELAARERAKGVFDTARRVLEPLGYTVKPPPPKWKKKPSVKSPPT